MIAPEKKTIEDILKGSSSRFSVPSYQRSFDWGKGELQDLIDDLKNSKESKTQNLFLGNFIFDVSDRSNLKIVDGQQRLTTISIILIAIREHAKKINESELAGEFQSLITVNSAWSGGQGSKIVVSENIRDIFEYMANREWGGNFPDKIGNKPIKRQVNKVKSIFNYVLDELSSYNRQDLLDFSKALMFSYVIVINVENTEDVFSIFERTNARGLDLNIGDLLKNYIFAHGIEEFEEKWNQIIGNADNSLQRMLKYFRISRNGHILQSELYKSLQKYGESLGIHEFVNDLYSFSRYYKIAQSLDEDDVKDRLEEIGLESLATTQDHYQRINRVFQALKLFRVTQAYPLIFSIFVLYKKTGNDNHNSLFKILECIENYHFVNNVICGRIGNEVEKFYADSAMKFFKKEEKFADAIVEFTNTLHSKKALQDDFVSNFIDSVTYDGKNIPLINYVFDRINNVGTKGAQRVDIYSPEKNLRKRNYNVEHFLPQSFKKSKNNEEDLELFDKIGNLLIISSHTNSQLQDKTPDEKMKIIKSDMKHLGNLRYLNDFIEKYEQASNDRNGECIINRSKDIAKDAYIKIWNF